VTLEPFTDADQLVMEIHEEARRAADEIGISQSRREMYVHIYTEQRLSERLVARESRIRELEAQQ
jgi:hypothetical protein